MRGIGQWASRPESWGPNWDPAKKKNSDLVKLALIELSYTSVQVTTLTAQHSSNLGTLFSYIDGPFVGDDLVLLELHLEWDIQHLGTPAPIPKWAIF